MMAEYNPTTGAERKVWRGSRSSEGGVRVASSVGNRFRGRRESGNTTGQVPLRKGLVVKRFIAGGALLIGTLRLPVTIGGAAHAFPLPSQPASENAGCAAVITHEFGPPAGARGGLVSFVARESHGDCFLPGG